MVHNYDTVHLNIVSFQYIYMLTSDSSLFSPRQCIIRKAEEEFIFPLVKKRGALT